MISITVQKSFVLRSVLCTRRLPLEFTFQTAAGRIAPLKADLSQLPGARLIVVPFGSLLASTQTTLGRTAHSWN